MLLIIPTGLSSHDPNTVIFNSKDKLYKKDPMFCNKSDQMTLELVFKHQQQAHIQLMSYLSSVSKLFHKLPFHIWMENNTSVHALCDETHKIL